MSNQVCSIIDTGLSKNACDKLAPEEKDMCRKYSNFVLGELAAPQCAVQFGKAVGVVSDVTSSVTTQVDTTSQVDTKTTGTCNFERQVTCRRGVDTSSNAADNGDITCTFSDIDASRELSCKVTSGGCTVSRSRMENGWPKPPATCTDVMGIQINGSDLTAMQSEIDSDGGTWTKKLTLEKK